MKHYRAFQIGDDGHVFGCVNLVWDGDEDAKRQASALANSCRIELWRLDKRVALFEASEPFATSMRDPGGFSQSASACVEGDAHRASGEEGWRTI